MRGKFQEESFEPPPACELMSKGSSSNPLRFHNICTLLCRASSSWRAMVRSRVDVVVPILYNLLELHMHIRVYGLLFRVEWSCVGENKDDKGCRGGPWRCIVAQSLEGQRFPQRIVSLSNLTGWKWIIKILNIFSMKIALLLHF